MKATHFKIIYTGTYKGNPYRYEEQVPATEYQYKSRFWLKFMPMEKRAAVEQLNNANDGDRFIWEYEGDNMEVQAFCV